jgi:hypothetical protein
MGAHEVGPDNASGASSNATPPTERARLVDPAEESNSHEVAGEEADAVRSQDRTMTDNMR